MASSSTAQINQLEERVEVLEKELQDLRQVLAPGLRLREAVTRMWKQTKVKDPRVLDRAIAAARRQAEREHRRAR
jgi:hypothetical protein